MNVALRRCAKGFQMVFSVSVAGGSFGCRGRAPRPAGWKLSEALRRRKPENRRRDRGEMAPPAWSGAWRTIVRLQKTLAFPLVFGGSTRHEKGASAPAKWRDNALPKIEPGRFWSKLFMQQCCPRLLFPSAGGASSPSEPFLSTEDAQKRVPPPESAPGGSRFRATMWEGNFREAAGHRPPPRPARQAVGLGVKP